MLSESPQEQRLLSLTIDKLINKSILMTPKFCNNTAGLLLS